MKKFKVGDIVKWQYHTAKIVWVNSDKFSHSEYCIQVDDWHNGHDSSCHRISGCPNTGDTGWFVSEDELELVKSYSGGSMAINAIAKIVLTKDDQALVEAGYLSETLDVTEKAIDAINSIEFIAHKTKLVALAKQDLKDAKKA